MGKYKTRQRRLLIGFFERNPAKEYTAEEIVGLLSPEEISQSAVYRNLDGLTHDGSIIKLADLDGRKSLYKLNFAAKCSGHLHLVCSACGSVIHLSDKDSERLVKVVTDLNGFAVDGKTTVLKGICKNCKNRREGA